MPETNLQEQKEPKAQGPLTIQRTFTSFSYLFSVLCFLTVSSTSCCPFYLFTSALFLHRTYASSHPMCPPYPVPPSMLFASKSHLQSRTTVTFTAVLLFVLCGGFSPVLSYLFRLVFLCGQGSFTVLCICSIQHKWNFSFHKSLEDPKYGLE